MRLKQYLTESTATKEDVEKNCSQILAYYKRHKRNILYRGLFSGNPKVITYKKHHKVRKPKDTPKEVHDELNKIFTKKFGWPVRNGLPVTTKREQAAIYGQPYIFFPFDKPIFKFVYSIDTEDLFNALEASFSSWMAIARDKHKNEDIPEPEFLPAGLTVFHSLFKARKNLEKKYPEFYKKIFKFVYDNAIHDVTEGFDQGKGIKDLNELFMQQAGEVFFNVKEYYVMSEPVSYSYFRIS